MEKQTIQQKQFSTAISENYGIIIHLLWEYIPPDDHEDVQQIILEAMWKKFQEFRHECKFSSLLWSICTYKCIDWLRAERIRKAKHKKYLWEMDIMQSNELPYSIIHKVRKAFEGLPRKDQRFLRLYFIENKKYYQVAKLMKLSETNVLQKARRLKEKMRSQIQFN